MAKALWPIIDKPVTRAAQGHWRCLTLKGQRHDCRSKMGCLAAVMDFAPEHPDYSGRSEALVVNKAAARRARAAE